MIRLGLTGSIGMGKSETLKMFQALGIPVYDSDAAVHRLYDVGGAAVPVVSEAFPGTEKEGRIDREALSKHVVGNPDELRRLENLVHPLVAHDRDEKVKAAKENNASLMVFDVPSVTSRNFTQLTWPIKPS